LGRVGAGADLPELVLAGVVLLVGGGPLGTGPGVGAAGATMAKLGIGAAAALGGVTCACASAGGGTTGIVLTTAGPACFGASSAFAAAARTAAA